MMETHNPYRSPNADVTAPAATGLDSTSPFDPSGRFGRLSYIAWAMLFSVALNLVQVLLAAVLGPTGAEANQPGFAVAAVGVITILLGLVMVAITVLFVIRRLHDIDLSAWWVLLGLLPVVNLIFGLFVLIKPGDIGTNRFGPPRDTRAWEKIVGGIGVALIALLLLMLVIGLIAVMLNPELVQQMEAALSAP
ncbi:MAG: DUF805 domain-containing protein [Thiohalocapsa sp.]